MFYSQTFLARKGPLSTVWIAAHLQHRLKKTHYISTDIPSTVLRIMDPGVPIALRMSANLLLGVVRIYSKKVDYVVQDCVDAMMGLLRTIASARSQQEVVGTAAFQSVTLPQNFDLDAQNIDYEIDYTGTEDPNTSNPEDITLTDRIPFTSDYYVTICFDEGPFSAVFDPVPMEEDPPQATTQVEPMEVRRGLSLSPPQATLVEEALEVGLVDANDDHNLENPPLFSNLEDNEAEPERMSGPSQSQFNPPTPLASQGDTISEQVLVDNNSPAFVLPESPPIQQPQGRGRKRKLLFDKNLVLTNKSMRNALNNTHDIMRKIRKAPSSHLHIWKLNNSQRKEHIFGQPLLTGVGKDLLDIYNGEYVRSRPHLVISEVDDVDGSMAAPSNQVPEVPIAEQVTDTNLTSEEPRAEQVTDTNLTSEEPIAVASFDIEVEHARNVAVTPPPTFQEHNVVDDDYRSPDRRDDLTMISLPNIPSAYGSGMMQTPDSDINSAATDEFWFLNLGNNTSTSSQGTSGTNMTLSERTKHAAEYLKRLNPITPILEDSAGDLSDLSLNRILEGKTRHTAARMFFEVLVLQTNRLVDVKQEEPYGDISLKLAATPSDPQS
ncbi:hypothetical protein PHAVU_005G038800 [Phaseolus vulgaris]|uniref:Rad21/Rec8-like protein N-terminal domain-containing protein n=1 Tax=Phaseolus vulgaris TaxID=3885 RepID=V7BST2_PHAVU|nr:hypothetical protein PHAVU_005G038800g [Phaseolus vulgaris]ESW21067.1 hypothetical protein PHAVU_005G038800g [Phaseolus vulgaris]